MATKASTENASKSPAPNRLINETSTYLLQHAHNPVDWYPWGEEAIKRARDEDKPILLSVGYSACHWCHVMEHESFEDEQTAEVMNKLFVSVKVDREERPDIDEIYMKAVQMLTGHGGWPMTVFLTPSLKPFYGGTYFPPEDRHGMPSFKRLMLSVAQAWQDQRENVEKSSEEITQHLSMFDQVPGHDGKLNEQLLEKALAKIATIFDPQWGGFGGAPKFPHSGTISLAMRFCTPRPNSKNFDPIKNMEIVQTSLDKMAYGGIYDQIGGGFARYSVDKFWLVPHFEKMLYDNALLARNYLEGVQLTGSAFWARVARGVLQFVLRELTTEDGAFYSSLDADSEGEEGKYYVWRPEEIIAVLGKDDGKWLMDVYGVTEQGNFEHGTSILHLPKSPEELAKRYSIDQKEFWARLEPLNTKLLQAREKRVHPGRDEKVLTSWNSLMISAFVDGYRVLKEPSYLAAAKRAANFIVENLYANNRLLRTWGRGKAKLNGYLEDYAYFVQALLDLSTVDFDPKWFELAVSLNEIMLEQFSDNRDNSFFFTSDEHEQLIARTKNFFDASVPSATSIAVTNLIRLGKLTGNKEYSDRAVAVMNIYAAYFDRAPEQFSYQLCALDMYLSGGTEIALLVDSQQPNSQDALFAIHSKYLPNSVIIVKDVSGPPGPTLDKSPLLESRQPISGQPTVFVCRDYSCQQPITDLSSIPKALIDR